MPPCPEPFALPDDLVAWIEEVGGGRLARADRRPCGARKEAWYVDLQRPDGTAALTSFLRYDRSDPLRSRDPWTLHREATVYLALQGAPVPVPRVLGVHPVHQAMLSERVAGETWFSRIRADPAEQEATAKDFMTKRPCCTPSTCRPSTCPSSPRSRRRRRLSRPSSTSGSGCCPSVAATPDPALAFALRWLRGNVPDHAGPPVLVQGDTGPGNFLYAGGRVTAVVDWELAHRGDPMDDIAWLMLRATQEPFTDLPRRLREYEVPRGNAIDEGRVHYYQVMAETKLQVMGHRPDAGPEPVPTGTLARRTATLEMLSSTRRCIGGCGSRRWRWPPGWSSRPPRRERPWTGATTTGCTTPCCPNSVMSSCPARPTRWLRRGAKGVARLIKYLALVDVYGGWYEACELDDLEALLGRRPESVATGRAAAADAVAAGAVTDRGVPAHVAGGAWPGVPSWPGRPWGCWPTGTGHRGWR